VRRRRHPGAAGADGPSFPIGAKKLANKPLTPASPSPKLSDCRGNVQADSRNGHRRLETALRATARLRAPSIPGGICRKLSAMSAQRILVFDPDCNDRQRYKDALAALGALKIDFAAPSDSPAELLKEHSYDLIVMALDPPDPRAMAMLAASRNGDGPLPVIIVSPTPSVEASAASQRLGAGDYLGKAQVAGQLASSAQRLLEERRRGAEYDLLRRQIERPYKFDDIIGGCPAMRRVFDTIEQVASSDVDVLVVGETGTGKELIARSIHGRSRRAAGPFVPVDCGAIPETLLESEFFGYEKGAFTGAESRRIGLLEFADHGTFFLDELGELPSILQAKLLRTLQERKIRRVGGREEIDVDVRIVAATARSLEDMIRKEHFRRDLYYRINVVRIELPPLRARGDDIGLLAEYLANRYSREMGRNVRGITPEAYQVLTHYRWPGNVRELQNVVRRAIALCQTGMIALDDLPDEVVTAAGQVAPDGTPMGDASAREGYFQARDQHVARFEKQYLNDLLTRHHGDVKAAAVEARLPRGTLYRLMKNHGLDGAGFR
jgi:DNA-binding NtrC family response regulator